jgi:hypothetical protein
MSVGSETEQQARIREEMDLTSRFTRMLIEDESIFDEMPAGATVFLYPEGDAEREAESRRSADRFVQRGQPVYVRGIPATQPRLAEESGIDFDAMIAEWHRVEDGW